MPINGTGSLIIEAKRVGADTLLSQIVDMVANAALACAHTKLADAVAGIFVPIVIGIAVLSYFAWAVWGPAPALSYALISAVGRSRMTLSLKTLQPNTSVGLVSLKLRGAWAGL